MFTKRLHTFTSKLLCARACTLGSVLLELMTAQAHERIGSDAHICKLSHVWAHALCHVGKKYKKIIGSLVAALGLELLEHGNVHVL